MDKFKKASQKIATMLDWNCNHVCKRHKGDTRLVHKIARSKLNKRLKEDISEYVNYENPLPDGISDRSDICTWNEEDLENHCECCVWYSYQYGCTWED